MLISIAVWLVTSSTVRHYAPLAERSAKDDAMLGAILVLAVATVLLPLTWIHPLRDGIPAPVRFLALALPALRPRQGSRTIHAGSP